MTERCTWTKEAGWITPEADGARPCPKSHCGMRGTCAHHVNTEVGEVTCPRCIGRARLDLIRIEQLYALDLEAEVTEDGVDSEAMTLLGVAAMPGAVDNRRGLCEYPRRHELHPYSVLGGWDLSLRETYGPTTELTITVSRAVAYLANLLDGTFPHGEEFEEFAKSIARCRAHLEDVVHLARKPETGRPCPTCADERGRGPKLVKVYVDHDRTGASDAWVCPDDGSHRWSDADYRLRVAADYLQHATALTADQIAARFGIKAGTVRVWANRGQVAKRGRDEKGRQLYDVSDTERMSS